MNTKRISQCSNSRVKPQYLIRRLSSYAVSESGSRYDRHYVLATIATTFSLRLPLPCYYPIATITTTFSLPVLPIRPTLPIRSILRIDKPDTTYTPDTTYIRPILPIRPRLPLRRILPSTVQYTILQRSLIYTIHYSATISNILHMCYCLFGRFRPLYESGYNKSSCGTAIGSSVLPYISHFPSNSILKYFSGTTSLTSPLHIRLHIGCCHILTVAPTSYGPPISEPGTNAPRFRPMRGGGGAL